jgi:3-keto-5-aminohexanoate cleavage enzyme
MGPTDYLSTEEVVLSVVPTAPERIGEDDALPTTPDAIATQVDESASLGASVATLYGWTEQGQPDPSALPDVAVAVREANDDVLIEYAVGPDCPLGDYLSVLDERPRPALAQVRLTPTQFGHRGVTSLTRRDVDRFIEELSERGIKPNLLVESGRDIHELQRLLESNLVSSPLVTLRLGARDGAVATPLTLMALLDALPTSAEVMVGATGPNQYPMTTMAIFLGAHVRVGMGDNRFLSLEDSVERNIQLIQRTAEVVYHSERSVADNAWVEKAFEIDGRRPEPP